MTNTNLVFFMDCNRGDDTVFYGTEEHMDGLRWDGGSPCVVSGNHNNQGNLRAAPEFWAENAIKFRELVASEERSISEF